MTTTIRISRPAVRVAGALLAAGGLAAGLAGCGGSSGATTTQAAAQPTAAPSDGATGGPGGARRFDPGQFQKIQACLSAAGITVPTPSFRSFSPGQRPSFTPGQRPSGSPSDRQGGGNRGLGQILRDPKAKAALDACGIAVPSFGPRPGGGQGGGPPSP